MGVDRAAPSLSAILARTTSSGLAIAALALALRTPVPPPSLTPPNTSEQAYVHDHTPHHGGVVGMVDDRHVEALALADGTLRVYLTDRWRVPLPLDGAKGTITVGAGSSTTTIALEREPDYLQASAAPLAGPTLSTRVDIELASGPVSIDFVLPIGARSGGAVGVPLEGCIAPRAEPTHQRERTRKTWHLRCTLDFANEVTALTATPDAKRLLLAAVDLGTSAWRLPEVMLDIGLDQPPPLVMRTAEAPHREAANTIVASPDSQRAVLALEGRLILYSLGDGKVLRELGKGRGVVRDVDWSSDGALLLVSRFYERAAALLRADDGSLVRELEVSDEVAAVALSSDATRAAVGTRSGRVVIFEVASARPLRKIEAGARAIEALVFSSSPVVGESERLVSAGADGALRIFDAESGRALAASTFETALYRLAIAPDRRSLVSGDRAGRVRVHDRSGTVTETLAGPRAGSSVLDLAFAGTSLVVSDALAGVTVWDRVGR